MLKHCIPFLCTLFIIASCGGDTENEAKENAATKSTEAKSAEDKSTEASSSFSISNNSNYSLLLDCELIQHSTCYKEKIAPGETITIGEYHAIASPLSPKEIFSQITVSANFSDDAFSEAMVITNEQWSVVHSQEQQREYFYSIQDNDLAHPLSVDSNSTSIFSLANNSNYILVLDCGLEEYIDCYEGEVPPGETVEIGRYEDIGGTPTPESLFQPLTISVKHSNNMSLQTKIVEPNEWKLIINEDLRKKYHHVINDSDLEREPAIEVDPNGTSTFLLSNNSNYTLVLSCHSTSYIIDLCYADEINPGERVEVGQYGSIGGAPRPEFIFDSFTILIKRSDNTLLQAKVVEADEWETLVDGARERIYHYSIMDSNLTFPD